MKQRRKRRSLAIPMMLGLALVCLASMVVYASTASNSIPMTRADAMQQVSSPDLVAPSECSGVGVSTIVSGTNGGNGSDLVLGTSAAEKMDGAKANDCVMGGAGDDDISGGAGTDVCIGGPGTDKFNGSCEVIYQ